MKKTWALILAALMLLPVFAGCSAKKSEAPEGETSAPNGEAATEIGEFVLTDEEKTDYTITTVGELKTTKIATIEKDDTHNYIQKCNGGFVYTTKDKMYGVMSLDAKNDTGAIYTYAYGKGDYFVATKVDPGSAKGDVSDLNCLGLIDCTGKEIVPEQYAAISVLNERYAKAIRATEQTTDKDEALVYSSNSESISFRAKDGDTFYKGEWEYYDVVTGKKVPGVTGTNRIAESTYGVILKYYTDAKEQKYVLPSGQEITDGVDFFKNGTYTKVDSQNKKRTVFKVDGTELFSISSDGFLNYDEDTNTYRFTEYGTMLETLYYENGEVFAKGIPYESGGNSSRKVGNFVFSNGKLLDTSGKQVVEGSFDRAGLDWMGRAIWLIKGNTATYVDLDGNVFFVMEEKDDVVIDDYFLVYKNAENRSDRRVYCVMDKDFTLPYGTSVSNWLIAAEKTDSGVDLIDTYTGKTVLTGYSKYEIANGPEGIQVIARKGNGNVDIFLLDD